MSQWIFPGKWTYPFSFKLDPHLPHSLDDAKYGSMQYQVQGLPQRMRLLSPKLKTGYSYKNQFWNPSFKNGVRQFCGYQYFCYKILFYLVFFIFPSIFRIFLIKIYKNVKTPKRNSFKFRKI